MFVYVRNEINRKKSIAIAVDGLRWTRDRECREAELTAIKTSRVRDRDERGIRGDSEEIAALNELNSIFYVLYQPFLYLLIKLLPCP